MKKYFLLFILLAGCCGLFAQRSKLETSISGYIPDMKDSVTIVEITTFNPENLKAPVDTYRTNVVSGRFEIKLSISKLSIVCATVNEHRLFFIPTTFIIVQPGDQIHIDIPDFKKLGLYDLKFSGKGIEKIEMEKKIYNEILSIYKTDKPTGKQSVSERYETTYRKLQAADSVLTANKKMVDDITFQFLKAHHAEETYDKLMYAMKNKEVNNVDYKQLFRDYVLDKKIVADIMPAIKAGSFNYNPTLRDIALLNYAYDNNIMVDSIQKNGSLYFKVVSDFYQAEPFIRDFILSNLSFSQIAHNGLTKQVRSFVDNYLATTPHGSIYRAQVEELRANAESNLAKGRDAYNFQLKNSEGKMVKLSNFRGKAVVIDFWFTGCVNCKVMKPLMENIEKLFVGKPVVFLSISIDANISTWKKMGIGRYSSKTALQLYTNGLGMKHPVVEKYIVRGYPKLAIVDREGKIYNANAQDPRYNYDKLVAQINDVIN